MVSSKTLFAGIGAITILTGAAFAQTTLSAKPSKYDKKFMTTVAQGGIAEVKLGKLAEEKASSPEVKQIAETIVADHTRANASLMEVAQQDGVALPKDTDKAHKAIYAKLQSLSGAAFDKAYIAGQVKDHHKTIALFQKHSNTKNAPLKTFITDYLPKIQEHTTMLDQIHSGKKPVMGDSMKAG